MYQLHKTNSIVGWVPFDYIDIMTIKSALYSFKSTVDGKEKDDVQFMNSLQSIINRISSLEQ
jgi:hypothetical protein